MCDSLINHSDADKSKIWAVYLFVTKLYLYNKLLNLFIFSNLTKLWTLGWKENVALFCILHNNNPNILLNYWEYLKKRLILLLCCIRWVLPNFLEDQNSSLSIKHNV